MIRAIHGAAIIGSPYLVVHPVMLFGWRAGPSREEALAVNIEYIKMLLPYAKQSGIAIAIENMPSASVPCGPVEELAACVDALDSAHVVACLDTGHALCCGQMPQDARYPEDWPFPVGDAACARRPGDAVRQLGSRLKVLHVHDNDGRRDLHQPPYSGLADWEDFTTALGEIHFSGAMSLELTLPDALPQAVRTQTERTLAVIADTLAREASV